MVKKIKIEQFKHISSAEISCKGVTFLTGPNGAGKTTVMEALSLAATVSTEMHDEADTAERAKTWYLKKLGHVPTATITLYTEDGTYAIKTNGTTGDTTVETAEQGIPLPEFNVRTVYPFHAPVAANFNKLSAVLNRLCTDSLLTKAPEELIADGTGTRLIDQLNYWLRRFADIEIKIHAEHGFSRYVCCRGSEQHAFGLTYAGEGLLSLIFLLNGCFQSKKGEILYINHPEAFLDASTQSKLMQFLILLSENSRQVFVETHSDHIFNSVRVGICTGTLLPEQIAVNFLRPESGTIICSEVELHDYGRFTTKTGTLDGFFDQYEKDLDAMLGL